MAADIEEERHIIFVQWRRRREGEIGRRRLEGRVIAMTELKL
jgi:hypothetical protein